ncbi:MAG: hypothetical protein BACD_00692 [Bacteroides rodentium]
MKWQVKLKKLFELKKRKLDRIPIADNNWDFLFVLISKSMIYGR